MRRLKKVVDYVLRILKSDRDTDKSGSDTQELSLLLIKVPVDRRSHVQSQRSAVTYISRNRRKFCLVQKGKGFFF